MDFHVGAVADVRGNRCPLRREERRIVQLPILIKHDDGRAESTTTEDVSKSGIRCCANMSLKVGERARIRLASPEGPGSVLR